VIVSTAGAAKEVVVLHPVEFFEQVWRFLGTGGRGNSFDKPDFGISIKPL
jgi:hypothetical protein